MGGPGDLELKKQEVTNLQEAYRDARVNLEESQRMRLVDEIDFYHERLHAADEALNGKNRSVKKGMGTGEAQKMHDELAPWKEMLDNLLTQKKNKLGSLNVESDDFVQQTKDIEEDIGAKERFVHGKICKIRAKYSRGSSKVAPGFDVDIEN